MFFTGENTEIQSVSAGETFAQKRYELKSIQEINDMQIDDTQNKKEYVDVLAIVTHVEELNVFQSRAGKEFKKRELTLVDASNIQVLFFSLEKFILVTLTFC